MPSIHEHKVTVRNYELRICPPWVVAGSKGADALVLDLDDDWDGLSVRVVLGEGEEAQEDDWTGEPLIIPADLTVEPRWLPVSVVGTDGETVTLTKAAPHAMQVVSGGYVREGV